MTKGKEISREKSLPFTKINYMVMGAAVLTIILGYISLSSGSITLAPILLVLGYCVLFPVGLIVGGKNEEVEQENS